MYLLKYCGHPLTYGIIILPEICYTPSVMFWVQMTWPVAHSTCTAAVWPRNFCPLETSTTRLPALEAVVRTSLQLKVGPMLLLRAQKNLSHPPFWAPSQGSLRAKLLPMLKLPSPTEFHLRKLLITDEMRPRNLSPCWARSSGCSSIWPSSSATPKSRLSSLKAESYMCGKRCKAIF